MGRTLTLRGIAKREGDFWASIVLDYNIVGTGDTPEDAIKRSLWMTRAYIEEGRKAGSSLAELRRPAPLRLRAEFRVAYCMRRMFAHDNHEHTGGTMPFTRDVKAVRC
jgi:hypothetical protein